MILATTAIATVVEAWKSAVHRMERAQIGTAIVVAVMIVAATSLAPRALPRVPLTDLAAIAMVLHGFALVSSGAAFGVLVVSVAPLAYAFARLTVPPRLVVR